MASCIARFDRRRLARLVLVLGGSVWIVNALLRWCLDAPLGHDEARYAIDSKAVLDGSGGRFVYSSAGMALLAMPGILGGATEQALRALPVLFGIGFLVAAWLVAMVTSGAITAAWVVGVLAGSHQLAKHSSELLSDLPSATCLLVAIALIARELSRDGGPRLRLVSVAPLFAAAFYLRFGSCVPIAVISVVVMLTCTREVRRHWRLVAVTACTFILLLVPHAITSLELTGSITGALRISSRLPVPPTSPIEYLTRPLALYGWTIAALCVLGILAVRRDVLRIMLVRIAVLHVIALAMTAHAQPRFVYFATVLLVILGVDTVVHISRLVSVPARMMLSTCALIAIAAAWVIALASARSYRDVKVAGPARALIAARVIAADRAPGEPCEVTGADLTRLEWYSGCRSVLVPGPREGIRLYVVGDGRNGAFTSGMRRVAFVPGIVDVRVGTEAR